MNRKITISISDNSFEYDVRSLVRAFFSDADVEFVRTLDDADMRIELTEDEVSIEWQGEHFHSLLSGKDRPEIKNSIKLLIYDVLSKSCGRELPWGTLTGVRPTKLVRSMIEEGMPLTLLRDNMYHKYRTSSARTNLAYEVALREKAIIDAEGDDAYCLYAGIPFCPSICLYCSFSSYPIARYEQLVEDYLKTLYGELKETSKLFAGRRLSAIYIGGGTPSSLSARQLEELMGCISEEFKPNEDVEWTVEAGRADSITEDKLRVLRSFGDIRLSINPQTFEQKTLDLIGRAHTVEDVERAFYAARETGFSNINMDIIVGLPGEGKEEVSRTLKRISSLKPDNLTVHSLALKRASRLHEQWAAYADSAFVNSDDIMDMVRSEAAAMGMKPYYLYRQKDIAGNLENTGFALPGKEGRYNILIMEDVSDIAACGAGAISKRVSGVKRISRAANVKGVEEYITRINEMKDRKRRLFS